jgi:hypothetical protein
MIYGGFSHSTSQKSNVYNEGGALCFFVAQDGACFPCKTPKMAKMALVWRDRGGSTREVRTDRTMSGRVRLSGFFMPPTACPFLPCRQAAHREKVASKTELDDRAIYVLTLRAEKHVADPIRMLRALLKIAGRQFGLKAIQIREQRDDIAA